MKLNGLCYSVSSTIALTFGLLLLSAPSTKAQQDGTSAQELATTQEQKVKIGFAINPVPLNLSGKNRILVGLGSYYVNAQGGCADCHSCPTYKVGHNPFPPINGDGKLDPAHYLAGGTPFELPGETVRSANLTPDAQGKPAGLDFDEFLKLIRKK